MTVLYVYDLFVIFCLPGFVVMLIETFTRFTKAIKIMYDYVSIAVFINSFSVEPSCVLLENQRDTTSCMLRK